MRRTPLVVVCYLLVGCLSSALGDIPIGGSVNDDNISLVYDPVDGNLSIDAAGKRWTTLEIVSESGVFTGPDHGCSWPGGPVILCDVVTAVKFFALVPEGLGDTDFGRQMAPSLAADFLSMDITVDGSLLPSGRIGAVDLIVVPEPSGSWLALELGIIVLSVLREKGQRCIWS